MFYDLTPTTKETLEGYPWSVGYSGGKDSTAMVLWLEWLRRTKQIKVPHPRLVQSDTGVELPFVMKISDELISKLEKTGWTYTRVYPKRKNKLYVYIFGAGMTPVNPGYRKMRWCTSSTKISPMERFRKTLTEDVLALTAVRWGESSTRDKKLQATCSAGGECGVITVSKDRNIFAPIIDWTLCQVYDWLQGLVTKEVTKFIPDLLETSKKLIQVYHFRKDSSQISLPMAEPDINSARMGCIGCPAIANDKAIQLSLPEHPEWSHLSGIYYIWDQVRIPFNRCQRIKINKKTGNPEIQYGPIKMHIRKKYFAEILKIQEASGVTLVTPKDIKLIHKMWKEERYPRGWSKKDETVVSLPQDGQIL